MKICKERQMIKAGETFMVLTVYVCVTILSACTGNVDSVPVPVDVIFDSQREEFLGSIRLALVQSQVELWDDYTQPVVISGHTLLLGTPSEFGNSAYVFGLCASFALDCR